MEKIEEVYKRFRYYRCTHDGIYIYPEYESDLDKLMEVLALYFEGVENEESN